MLESTGFSFNGVSSSTLGLINCKVSSGLFEEQFLSDIELNEVEIRGKETPYFQGIQRKPREFDLTFAFEDPYDDNKLRLVARTFNVSIYCPLVFDDMPNITYYCIPVDTSQLYHTGAKTGYITITFRCDSPYGYFTAATPTFYSATPTFSINNTGDITIKPEIEITKIGNGDIEIINITNNNQSLKFETLVDGEVLYVNCETETIITDLADVYRYSNKVGDDFIELLRGVNEFSTVGNATIEFRYQCKVLQGTYT